MATPCKKCGAEKTEAVGHAIMYSIAKMFGYRLRICSRCHRYRLLSRHDEHHHTENSEPQSALPGACPRCGKKDYRRSRRNMWERVVRRGPMVRCRACRHRFPQPRPTTF
jgi:hypothetical protein